MSLNQVLFSKEFIVLSFRFGVISAILMATLTLFYFFIAGSGSTPVIIWNYLIFTSVLFFNTKTCSEKIFKGKITFKELYVSSIYTGIFASVIFAIFMVFYAQYIDIEFIKNFIHINSMFENKDFSNNSINQQIQLITPVAIGFYAFGQLLLMSLFLPLIIYIFFKTGRNKLIKINN